MQEVKENLNTNIIDLAKHEANSLDRVAHAIPEQVQDQQEEVFNGTRSAAAPALPDENRLINSILAQAQELAQARERAIEQRPEASGKNGKSKEKWTPGKIFGLLSNGIGAMLHSTAIVTQAIPLLPKELTEKVNKFTQEYARYVGPVNSALNGLAAVKGKRGFEMGIRVGYFLLSLFVPFFNFTLPFGIHSGLNFLHDSVMNNLKKKAKEAGEKLKFESFGDNAKHVWGETKTVMKDLFSAKSLGELLSGKINKGKQITFACIMMAASSIVAMITSRNDRITPLAKVLGFIRNFFGLHGDFLLTVGQKEELHGAGKGEFVDNLKDFKELFKNKHTRSNSFAGSFMGIGSILGIVHRLFVKNEWLANIIVHTQMFFDNVGSTFWSLLSEERNEAAA